MDLVLSRTLADHGCVLVEDENRVLLRSPKVSSAELMHMVDVHERLERGVDFKFLDARKSEAQ